MIISITGGYVTFYHIKYLKTHACPEVIITLEKFPAAHCILGIGLVWFMVFNNISVISRRSVLLVEKTAVPGENHQPVASHWQTLSHNVVSSTPRHEQGSYSQL